MTDAKPAVVLLSGGLDSAVVLAICRAEGFAPSALTLDYGQRHRLELEAARRIAAVMGVNRHEILTVDLSRWGGSALTGDHAVPTGRDPATMAREIPITYVPARNTVFLSIAMSWAETLGTEHIFIGAHALDYSGYPDCRPEYFRAFEAMANLATRTGVEGKRPWTIHTPLIGMTKTEIVERGRSLAVPFALTLSCYQPAAGASCGICDACILRLRAFAAVGLRDPITYAPVRETGS